MTILPLIVATDDESHRNNFRYTNSFCFVADRDNCNWECQSFVVVMAEMLIGKQNSNNVNYDDNSNVDHNVSIGIAMMTILSNVNDDCY